MPSVYSVVKKGISQRFLFYTIFSFPFLCRNAYRQHCLMQQLFPLLCPQTSDACSFHILHGSALPGSPCPSSIACLYSYFLRFKDWQYDKSGRRKFGGLRKFRSNRTAFHRPSLLNQADPDFIISGSKFRSRFLKDGTRFGSHCFSIGIGGGKCIT